uniref:Arginyl-tRNA--protein transferase 1 n=1 Tax=Schistocephalus solidus TaxID=70667 RepID=A0A0X3NN19_SCHSO
MQKLGQRSIVTVLGCHEKGKCRYCKQTDFPNMAWFMNAEKLTVADYQALMERGWRRSGNICYQPTNSINCCPCYAIRCDALNFKPSRSQRRVLTDMVTFLNTGKKSDGERIANTRVVEEDPLLVELRNIYTSVDGDSCSKFRTSRFRTMSYHREDAPDSGICLVEKDEVPWKNLTSESEQKPSVDQRSGSSKRKRWKALQEKIYLRSVREGVHYEKLMAEYFERRQKRLAKNKPKEMEEILEQIKPEEEAKHFIQMRLCPINPRTPELEKVLRQEFEIYKRYSERVHGTVYKDSDYDIFVQALVDSPIILEDTGAGKNSQLPYFGSFHQQYWLDGKQLMAVGVIDIVPGYLSSSYFFYDPDFEFLHLGNYSAMQEIQMVRNIYRLYGPESLKPVTSLANFKYYTMGFYIHSIGKMNYKGKFFPSYLACPESHTWYPIQNCRPLLDVNKYSRLSPPYIPDVQSTSKISTEDLLRRLICIFLRTSPTTAKTSVLQKLRSTLTRKGEYQEEAILMPLAELSPFASKEFVEMLVDWSDSAGLIALDGRMLINYVW